MLECVINFFCENVVYRDIHQKSILEIGSDNVNGTLRTVFEPSAKAYIGIDLKAPNKYIQRTLDVKDLLTIYGEEFDVVISTETLEHVEDWKTAVLNMKTVLKPGGLLMLSTCTRNFAKHDHPGDYWRFEKEDFEKIFADFNISKINLTPEHNSIQMLARKPGTWQPIDLSSIEVYRVP